MCYQLLLTAACALPPVPALQGADGPAQPTEPTAERVRLVRRAYAKLPCEILGLAEPVKFAGVGYSYSDNKWEVRNVVLKDARGKKLPISLGSWDGEGGKSADSLWLDRERLPPGPEEAAAAISGWGFSDRERLPGRAPEEAAVYGLLLRLPKEDREAAEVAEILKVLDKRFAGAMPGRRPSE